MAIIRCPKCSKDVSDQVAYCPHCGGIIQGKQINGCLPAIGIGLVSLVVIIATFDSGNGGKPPSTSTPESSVRALCRVEIEARLHDPDSAKFEVSNANITSKNGDTWTVIRPVRAKNAFNATVRNTFQCRYKQTGNKFALIDIYRLD